MLKYIKIRIILLLDTFHKLYLSLVYLGVSENVVYPIVPNGFADHYPYEKWLAIIGNINPTFSDKPIYHGAGSRHLGHLCQEAALKAHQSAFMEAPFKVMRQPAVLRRIKLV